MARIDLNIVDRGIQGSDWVAEDVGLTAEHLDKVLEMKTDNSGALNSLPTPFARFFVAREAFRRATEEYLDTRNEKEAGFAYRQLVSDILDVFELLFNIKYHTNNTWKNGEQIELREWRSRENLDYLKKQMPVLYNSLENYYTTDINQDSLYFLVYTAEGKDVLLACSSPITGFVTPPDLDKAVVKKNGSNETVCSGDQYNSLYIHRKSGGFYFRDIKMFEEREQDFKNYMFNELFGSDNVSESFKELKEYIRSFKNDKDIRNDYKIKLTPIKTDQNSDLIINQLAIQSCDEIDINSFFNNSIIKLPYRISRDRFKAVNYKNDDTKRDYDYLLPFKPEVLNLFEGNEIDSYVNINRHDITVFLRYNGKEYKKDYSTNPSNGAGKIYELAPANINFDLGIFPNILSHRDEENNYFKIFVAGADEDPEAPNFSIDNISLSFYKYKGTDISLIRELDPSSAEFGVLPAVVRSNQVKNGVECGTKFYELFNSSFDVIEVSMYGLHSGFIMPIWERSQETNEQFRYAIDLGTSNTFISRCKIGENNKPELFNMQRPMVSYLHEIPEDAQLSLAKCIEDSIFDRAKDKIKTEFVPAIIDGNDYKFPIRTALCGIKNKSNAPKLFDNHNIAFFYEKLMSNDDQNIHTDIKWDKNDAMLRVYIRELLLIIKCDILQRNGDLDRTSLVWFKPLSFMGNTRAMYLDIWENEPKNILSLNQDRIECFSESEAPYYYFKKMDYIKDSDAAAVIDIGGGSTDFVYFQDNRPIMANSIHFGCDVLWENGLIEFENVRNNGIYRKYEKTIRFTKNGLQDLNDCFINVDNATTKDIINFWLSNSDSCDIKRNLSADFKPVFIYHLTSILFYMANMFKENEYTAPRTVVFSGNGSKYIDSFICSDKRILKKIIDLVFNRVFGTGNDIHVVLPCERKESTCYGGLYRDPNADDVPEKVYQGDNSMNYDTVGEINKNFEILKSKLVSKYNELSALYKDILDLLKREHIIDNTENTSIYVEKSKEDMGVALSTYYKSQVKEKYQDEVLLYDSVFFLPIINRVFEMTNLNL